MGEGSHIYGNKVRNRTANNELTPEERRRRGTERMMAKSDINGGLTKSQQVALTKWENSHRENKTERVVAIDENGRVLAASSSGSRTRTKLPTNIPPNSVISHNHPSGSNGNSTRVGSSFSGADIAAAIQTNAKEIRVVAGNYTYSLRRPKNGWGDSANNVLKAWKAHWDKNSPTLNEYIDNAKLGGRTKRIQRANTLASHLVTREFAKKYGWNYTRKRTK